MKPTRLFLVTFAAMLAFAGNSLLCRFALKQTAIDAASFTYVRIFSGALILYFLARVRGAATKSAGNWPSACALFAYAAAFSFAYISLPAGTGALLLFGAVQATMILWSLWAGERLRILQIVGLTSALAGLVALVFPGISAPPFRGSLLMLSAGVGWGIYSLRGRLNLDPIAATAGNFLRALPFAALLGLVSLRYLRLDFAGLGYAIISGAITSGLGYVLWYTALPKLKAASAATVQLSVPMLAAGGGILLLGEPLTLRFLLASLAILGGIALVVWQADARGAER